METVSSSSRKAKIKGISTVIKSCAKFYHSESVEVQGEPDVFNVISSYYKACSFDDYYSEDILSNISNCNALKLVKNIIALLSKPWKVEKERILPENFYKQIVCKKANSFLSDADEDLIKYYYSQLAHIMKAGKMIKHFKGEIILDLPSDSDIDIYLALLKAFWNLVEWEDIFPSNVDMAKSLYNDRNIFKDMLLKETIVDVQSISNRFSDLTGISNLADISNKNNKSFTPDKIFASFLDFYLLKWLEHFNLVKYQNGLSNDRVSFEVSGFAPEIFEIISYK